MRKSLKPALFIFVVLSIMTMGATCSPKNTCEGIQKWNLKSGEIIKATWDTWHDFYRTDGYTSVVDGLLEEYGDKLTLKEVDELIEVVGGRALPTTPLVAEIFDEYKARMSNYNGVSEKLEKSLNYTAESMEIIEHAMLSCQDFTDKEVFNALLEASQGLLEIMDILEEAGVPVPQMLLDAKDTADGIIESLKK